MQTTTTTLALDCDNVDDGAVFNHDVVFDADNVDRRRFKRSFQPFRSEKFMSKQVLCLINKVVVAPLT